jgi:hypothetical protein
MVDNGDLNGSLDANTKLFWSFSLSDIMIFHGGISGTVW